MKQVIEYTRIYQNPRGTIIHEHVIEEVNTHNQKQGLAPIHQLTPAQRDAIMKQRK